ncbi:MAG: TIGR04372 family glycosyltransferase [Acidobacteria bacterium]|nr:TIGR04372 family glycosyltransferase [Acidobacteriota bacterium]
MGSELKTHYSKLLDVHLDPIRVNVGGRPVLVVMPDVSRIEGLSVELLATYNRARAEHADACLLTSVEPSHHPLLALEPSDLRIVHADGVSGAWLRLLWRMAAVERRAVDGWSRASRAFRVEWSRELRRQGGDERLPLELRGWLRARARRSLAKAAVPPGATTRFPRRLLRDRVHASLPSGMLAEASATARALGIDPAVPTVTVDVRRRPDTCASVSSWLANRGYCVVRVGEAPDPVPVRATIDLASSRQRTPLLDLFVLSTSRFLVCDSLEAQHVAYLTNTPSLLLNAHDPFSGYPVRDDGLFTLSTPVDLDTGQTLTPDALLHEARLKDVRDCGFRDNTAAEVLAAVQEMHDGVTAGWSTSPGQIRFRDRVAAAGEAMAARVAAAAEWGPDAGFIGDGRLARWQAEGSAS